MSETLSPSLFRVDTFTVPTASLSVFLARVHDVDRLLGRQPGCRQHLVLTKVEGPSESKVITIVEWASEATMAQAKATMQAHYANEGFDPPTFMRNLGVRADMSVYTAHAG